MTAMTQTVSGPQPLQRGAVWTLSGAHMLNDLMTSGVVPALLPLYKAAFHLTYTQAGLVVLTSYMTSSVSQPMLGMWTDRRPQPWLLPIGALLTGTGLSLSGLVPNYSLLLLVVAMSGLGSGVFHPEASRGAHLAAGPAKGLAQAIFQVGGNSGQALGPLMMPLFLLRTGLHGLVWFLLVGLLGSLLTLRLVPWYRQYAAQDECWAHEQTGNNHPWAMAWFILGVTVRSWATIGVLGFLPFFYLHRHVPLAQADLYTFLFSAAGAVATFLGGPLSDRFGRKWMMFGATAASIPFAAALPHLDGWLSVLDLLLLGFTLMSTFAVAVVYGQQLLPSRIGLASGLVIGMGIGAGGIGAAFMGSFADAFGIATVMNWYVTLPLLAAFILAWLPGDGVLTSHTPRKSA